MKFDLKPVLYIQISPDHLTVTNVRTGASISEVPEMAIAAKPERILAVGADARAAAASTSARLVNPFAHPRSLVSDFTVAEQLLKFFVRRSLGNGLLLLKPRVVIHPLGDPEGGFTQVERRAFREMALGAGAGEAVLWTGRPLTNAEILASAYPLQDGTADCA